MKGGINLELSKKIQELRKQKKITQEELAEALFVSKSAILKWESGKAYPSIDSLKEMAKYFSVSIDELLSNEEILLLAEEDSKQNERHLRDLVFGFLDCSVIMLLFLPFFEQKINGVIYPVSLHYLKHFEPYMKTAYTAIVAGLVACGLLTLFLQNCWRTFWINIKGKISLTLSAFGALIFMISAQPNAAMYTFVLLIIKAVMLIKWA
jgi:transcriptional regulator with XRE-family HTH domain